MTAAIAAAAFLAALALAAELLLRRMGFGAFPLYEPVPGSVYRMRPDQQGRFMNRYRWRYDANGMRNDAVPADFSATTLLVGDSIVDGGLRIDQNETFGALLAKRCGENVYALGCHGWGLANSLEALAAIPGWERARRLIFVLNTGDFDWRGKLVNELSFPTRHPYWLSFWMVRRLVFRRVQGFLDVRQTARNYAAGTPYRDETMRAANIARFVDLLTRYPGPVVVVRYPARSEDARRDLFCERLVEVDGRVHLIEVDEAPGWSDDCYADNVHPSARGIELLAGYVCDRLR